jgi:release factor glutamine methyltransferase
MNDQAPWTIHRLLNWTADYFRQGGADSPRLDAEILLSETLGCRRIDLYARFDQVPTAEHLAAFRALVRRRSAGEPVAYLVSRKEFYSLMFEVTPDVLIPRPETEQLVVETLDALRSRGDWTAPRVLDVGTGSGIIAVAVAKHHPTARLFASDLSEAALSVARRNAQRHGVEDRIEFRSGDLLEPWAGEEPLHVIVSNPPYIGLRERPGVGRTVKDFEPEIALFSGDTGSETVERLLAQAIPRLVEGGRLIVEISPVIAPRVRQLAQQASSAALLQIKRDLAGEDRVAIFGRNP